MLTHNTLCRCEKQHIFLCNIYDWLKLDKTIKDENKSYSENHSSDMIYHPILKKWVSIYSSDGKDAYEYYMKEFKKVYPKFNQKDHLMTGAWPCLAAQ